MDDNNTNSRVLIPHNTKLNNSDNNHNWTKESLT